MPEIKFDSEWLKAGVNVIEGDKIIFADSGQKDSKGRWVFLVMVISGKTGKTRCQKKFSLNKANFIAISSFYGSNSDNWIGKEMTIHIMKVQDPSGKLVNGVRLAGKDDVLSVDLDADETELPGKAEDDDFLE